MRPQPSIFGSLPTGAAIAEQLVAHRKARGVTQKAFARELGIDPSTLAKWEGASRNHAPTVAQKLSLVLIFSLGRVFHGLLYAFALIAPSSTQNY